MKRSIILIVAACSAACLSGCTTMKRAALTGAGAAAGAGAGYALAPQGKKAAGAAIGAVVGAVGTAAAQGRNPEDYQEGVDDGYTQASSDDIKRLYWAKQALEKKKGEGENTVTRYYVFEDEGTTADGRKLAPEKVAVAVVEPERAK